MRTHRLVLLLALAACEPSDTGRAPEAQAPVAQALVPAVQADSVAVAAVRARYPGVRLRDGRGEAVPGTEYRAASFGFDTPGRDDRYGAILAVWTADAGRLVWTREHRGDFTPHRLVWMDADRDGRTDLFFTAGEEDVSETYLFVSRTGRGASPDSAFTLAYHNGDAYTAVLDLDGDGAAELIEPQGPRAGIGERAPCSDAPPPRHVLEAAAAEYARRVGAFDRANVKYYESAFEPWTLHLLDPVRILQLREGQVRDATPRFGEHLRWRIGILVQWRAAASGECRARIEAVLQHLNGVTSE